jgi:murein L,D-transpeptidase YcbB/YkuD
VHKPLKAGPPEADARALRGRLAVEDSQLALAPEKAAAYDGVLAETVSRVQARYGLNADGSAGPTTIAAQVIGPAHPPG